MTTVKAKMTKLSAFTRIKPNGNSSTVTAKCEALWFESDDGEKGIFIPSENLYFYHKDFESEVVQMINEFVLTK